MIEIAFRLIKENSQGKRKITVDFDSEKII